MQFGKVDNPEQIDFSLPADHPSNLAVLQKHQQDKPPNIYVGCAKWNRSELKNFYPRGTKDELQYYASQFNSIEFNASFYRIFPPAQFEKWRDKTPPHFKFFPKVSQEISHFKRLLDTERVVDEYIHSVEQLGEKLGMVFLQMNGNFAPKDFDRVQRFVTHWPKHIPLAIEFRHTQWYNDEVIAQALYQLLEEHEITNNITDTAGRRDLLHMRLTTPTAFVRYVGANHSSDYSRLDDWVDRLKQWKNQGVQNIYFFIHQNLEQASPLLAAYFIQKLNKQMDAKLAVPHALNDQSKLF